MRRRLATAGILALAAAGCIVTDEIEFFDDVNNPPEVIGVQPANAAVIPVCREIQEFTVTLWEPDVEDAPPQTEAEIRVWIGADAASEGQVAGDCTVAAAAPAADSPYDGGVLLTVVCTMEILTNSSFSVPDGDILVTRVLVSDRPFVHGVPPETARTAEVFWTLVVLPTEECQ